MATTRMSTHPKKAPKRENKQAEKIRGANRNKELENADLHYATAVVAAKNRLHPGYSIGKRDPVMQIMEERAAARKKK